MAHSTRLEQFDILKGIGILLVILGHCCCPPSFTLTWIYGFHMALFFVVSGFFYKQKPIKVLLSSDYKRILLPYFYFVTILIIWDMVYLTYKNHSLLEAVRMILSDFNPLNDDCRDLYYTIWFLPCMFEVHIIYHFLSKLKIRVCTIFAVICYVIGYMLHIYNINIPFFLDSALSVIIYYHLGQVFKHLKLQNKDLHFTILAIIIIAYTLFIYLAFPRVELCMNKFPWYSVLISIPMIYALFKFREFLTRHFTLI